MYLFDENDDKIATIDLADLNRDAAEQILKDHGFEKVKLNIEVRIQGLAA